MAKQDLNTNVPALVTLNVPEPLPFNDVISTLTLTSQNFEKKISEFFKAVFADFEGCKIESMQIPGQPESTKVKLYFKPCTLKSDDSVYAVKIRGEKNAKNNMGKGINLSTIINTVNAINTAKQFELDEMAQEILSEYLFLSDSNAKFVDRYNEDMKKVVKVRLPKNWNLYTEEITDKVGTTGFQTPYLVVRLDLVPLVAKLFGTKDPEEEKKLAAEGRIPRDRYQYSVNIVKVLNPTMKSYILEIRRVDKKSLDTLAQSIGYGMVTGNIVMTR